MICDAKGDSVQIARMYMDSLLVESRIVGAVYPDTTFRFLDETFAMPVMTAALSHLDLVSMAEGAKMAGAPVSIGMGVNEEMGKVLATGAKVMKIVTKEIAKPSRNAVMIPLRRKEDLCFILQAAERLAVGNAVDVPLETAAYGVRFFRNCAAPRLRGAQPVRSNQKKLVCLPLFPESTHSTHMRHLRFSRL